MWGYGETPTKPPYNHYTEKNYEPSKQQWSLKKKSQATKFMDLVECKTVQLLYTARNNLLPGIVQKTFQTELEGLQKNIVFVPLSKVYMCVSNCGVNFVEWGRGRTYGKQKNESIIKKRHKKLIFESYWNEKMGLLLSWLWHPWCCCLWLLIIR